VKRYKTMHKFKPEILLSALLVFALIQETWSQAAPSVPSTSPEVNAAVQSSLASGQAVKTAASTPQSSATILIGPGDLLKVSVLGAPESDQEVRVDGHGDITLNFIGAVHVVGFTVEQAQAIIAKKLVQGGFFTDPQVSVFTKEYATQGISVLGEVLKPGVYPLLGSRRLFDALSLAGGVTPRAGKTIAITHRDNPLQPTIVSLSNDPAATVESNVEVFPGDTVLVSKAGVVYVVGDVKKPTAVVMENGTITVLQALAVAEGANPTAALTRSVLMRKTPNGHQEIPLDIKGMLANKTPDVSAQAEDVIFVPTSAAKSAGRRTFETIMQGAVGLAWRPF
jgi:polysaccharide biosynthesis/export protein